MGFLLRGRRYIRARVPAEMFSGLRCGYGEAALSGGTRCAARLRPLFAPQKSRIDTPRVRVVALGACGGGTSGGAGMIHRGARMPASFACITLIEKEAGMNEGLKSPVRVRPLGLDAYGCDGDIA